MHPNIEELAKETMALDIEADEEFREAARCDAPKKTA